MIFRCHYIFPFLIATLSGNGSSSAAAFSQQQSSPSLRQDSRSTSSKASESSDKRLSPPTSEDKAAEQRFAQQGILTGDLKLRTTPESVAGRGVFVDEAAKPKNVGDLLAFVPSQTVLTPSMAASRYPDLHERLELAPKALEWPMRLTAYAQRALEDPVREDWADNVRFWRGYEPNYLSRPPDDFREEELQSLAVQARSSPENIRNTLRVRWEDFQQQFRLLQQALQEEEGEGSSFLPVRRDLYEGVLSRAISLTDFGARDNTRYSVVPFQDMINHHNDLLQNNVALYSLGAIRQMAPAPELVMNCLERNFAVDPESILDTDLCIVAIQPIRPGEEVLNSYTWSQEPLSEDQRVWKLLQYGFPME